MPSCLFDYFLSLGGRLVFAYTDYHRYALMYTCFGLTPGGTCAEGAMRVNVMSRSRTVPQGVLQGQFNPLLTSMCVDPNMMQDITHERKQLL